MQIMAMAFITLPEAPIWGDVLDLANLYGKLFSKYKPDDPKNPMGQTYKSIPASNVRNITKGHNDYKSGKLGQ